MCWIRVRRPRPRSAVTQASSAGTKATLVGDSIYSGRRGHGDRGENPAAAHRWRRWEALWLAGRATTRRTAASSSRQTPPRSPRYSKTQQMLVCSFLLLPQGRSRHPSLRGSLLPQHAALVRESTLRPDLAEVPAAANFKFPAKETAPSEAPAPPSWLDPQEAARPDVKEPGCEMDIVFFGWSEIQVWEHHTDLIAGAATALCSRMGLLPL